MTEILTAQERQIMDVIYADPGLTVAEVNEHLGEGSTYSSTRAALYRLVHKGHLRSHRQGVRHLYFPVIDARSAGRSAVKRVMDTFFGGSPAATIGAVLGFSMEKLSEEEINQLEALIEAAKAKQHRRGPRK